MILFNKLMSSLERKFNLDLGVVDTRGSLQQSPPKRRIITKKGSFDEATLKRRVDEE